MLICSRAELSVKMKPPACLTVAAYALGTGDLQTTHSRARVRVLEVGHSSACEHNSCNRYQARERENEGDRHLRIESNKIPSLRWSNPTI